LLVELENQLAIEDQTQGQITEMKRKVSTLLAQIKDYNVE
jgi:hypothetical protein